MTAPSTPSIADQLRSYGIQNAEEILYNPDYETLFQEETRPDLTGYERGRVTESGAVAVDTGIFTGRSPKDKYFVKDSTTEDTLWWSDQGPHSHFFRVLWCRVPEPSPDTLRRGTEKTHATRRRRGLPGEHGMEWHREAHLHRGHPQDHRCHPRLLH